MSRDTSALAHPKHPHAQRQKKAKDQAARKVFRDQVWQRDGGRSRVNGEILFRSHGCKVYRGNVCHLQSRGAHPERALDPTNAILMSEYHHIMSDARGGRVLRLTDAETSEPATDATRPIRFTLYDKAGAVVWTRVS